MANYWVITIGINQYRHIQPLMHAQSDALFIHKFFTEEASVATNRCVLLSDLATSVGAQVVYPDKPAIAQWVQTITSQVGAGDVLWFYFSGYGTQADGADYLMPIDGDLDQIEETGIALSDLIDAIAALPTDKAVLVLDINRSQGALPDQAIGTQVIQLAEKRHVATILSCQPEQYSHETLGVRHGLFTAALLEALQQGYSTLGQISDYLVKRLPELCEHHWRPIQNAVFVMSDEQKIATLVPELATSINSITASEVATRVNSESTSSNLAETSVAKTPIAAGAVAAGGRLSERPYAEESAGTSSYRTVSDRPQRTEGSEPFSSDRLVKTASSEDPDTLAPVEDNDSAIAPDGTATDEPKAINGAKLRNWGLLVLALLMGLVLLKQPFVRAAWNNLIEKLEIATGWGVDVESEDLEGAESASANNTESDNPEATAVETADSSPTDGLAAEPAETAEPAAAQTSEPASENTAVSAAGNQAGTPTDTAASEGTTAALIAQAEAAIEKKQYSEALTALKEVPRDQRDSKFSSVLIKARVGASEAEQTNAALLTDALTAIQPTQASQFTEAIATARRIQPGEPLYENAQRNIQSWSQTILDIAEGRAASGNLNGAIAAAQALPRDDAEAYQKAQDRIASWQQRQQSREIIEVAKTIPKNGQASTYQKGIVKLREVPIEHPEYETSERLADEWSSRIFSIAQARAAQGRQDAAIQAALLVPAGTTAYEPTQKAIRRWRSEAQGN